MFGSSQKPATLRLGSAESPNMLAPRPLQENVWGIAPLGFGAFRV